MNLFCSNCVLLFILFLFLSTTATAVTISTDITFVVSNKTYKVQNTMVFSQIVIDSSYIIFNQSCFRISSPYDMLITLVYIRNGQGQINDRMLDFYADTSSGPDTFAISGFAKLDVFSIKRDNVMFASSAPDSSGYIRFTNNVWGRHFQIYKVNAPDWDVNGDGGGSILDLVYTSNHYQEHGSNGWLREDVDNNGRIEVLDVSIVSLYYGESWW